MTISLNDEPERLQVLPPLDVDLVDKTLLLKVQSNPMPMPTTTPRDKEVFWSTLKSEFPAFVDFLAHYTIPVELCDTRCGIAPFHHPELLHKLQETTPEQHLLELVDLVHFCGSRADAWSGTATQLTAMLQNDSRLGSQARELLHSPQNCGTYLARLVAANNRRVSSRLLHGLRIYTIAAPDLGGQGDLFGNFNSLERCMEGSGKHVESGRSAVSGSQSGGSAPPVHPQPQPLSSSVRQFLEPCLVRTDRGLAPPFDPIQDTPDGLGRSIMRGQETDPTTSDGGNHLRQAS